MLFLKEHDTSHVSRNNPNLMFGLEQLEWPECGWTSIEFCRNSANSRIVPCMMGMTVVYLFKTEYIQLYILKTTKFGFCLQKPPKLYKHTGHVPGHVGVMVGGMC